MTTRKRTKIAVHLKSRQRCGETRATAPRPLRRYELALDRRADQPLLGIAGKIET
jgi:hypothetical protein